MQLCSLLVIPDTISTTVIDNGWMGGGERGKGETKVRGRGKRGERGERERQ